MRVIRTDPQAWETVVNHPPFEPGEPEAPPRINRELLHDRPERLGWWSPFPDRSHEQAANTRSTPSATGN